MKTKMTRLELLKYLRNNNIEFYCDKRKEHYRIKAYVPVLSIPGLEKTLVFYKNTKKVWNRVMGRDSLDDSVYFFYTLDGEMITGELYKIYHRVG